MKHGLHMSGLGMGCRRMDAETPSLEELLRQVQQDAEILQPDQASDGQPDIESRDLELDRLPDSAELKAVLEAELPTAEPTKTGDVMSLRMAMRLCYTLLSCHMISRLQQSDTPCPTAQDKAGREIQQPLPASGVPAVWDTRLCQAVMTLPLAAALESVIATLRSEDSRRTDGVDAGFIKCGKAARKTARKLSWYQPPGGNIA